MERLYIICGVNCYNNSRICIIKCMLVPSYSISSIFSNIEIFCSCTIFFNQYSYFYFSSPSLLHPILDYFHSHLSNYSNCILQNNFCLKQSISNKVLDTQFFCIRTQLSSFSWESFLNFDMFPCRFIFHLLVIPVENWLLNTARLINSEYFF